ncbi:hypothetical protein DMUE_3854 [Dictyocoela muelleri]|nr:hypothetical protein DMUE_3854 [Dictyocoela muelleri]
MPPAFFRTALCIQTIKNLLGKSNDFDKKANRWKAILSDISIEYEHINGDKNLIADELSRNKRDFIIVQDILGTNNLNFKTKLNKLKEFTILHGHPGFITSFLTFRKTK